jgi:hypothetical protein
MPTVAAYLVLQDPPAFIGGPGESSDQHIQFEVPKDWDIDKSAPSILAFRMEPTTTEGEVKLKARLNSTEILLLSFKTEFQRSMHEIFPSTAFMPYGNEVVFSVPSSEHPHRVTVSDVFLLVPIRVPPRREVVVGSGAAVQIFVGDSRPS